MSKLKSLSCVFIFLSAILCGEPWGKDVDLVHKKCAVVEVTKCKTPLFGHLGEGLIRFHQTTISPADGPRSNFIPSSSQYMLDAIRKYGFFKGFSMGCDRLMRENPDPWVYRETVNDQGCRMKWDPVP